MSDSFRTAEIYPIQRLPRRFGIFDYLLPEGVAITPGDLVRIPFRDKETFGIVKGFGERSGSRERWKPVGDVVAQLRLTEGELGCYELLAAELVQSVSSLLYAALPTPGKRPSPQEPINGEPLRVRASEAPALSKMLEAMVGHRRAFVTVTDFVQSVALAVAYALSHREERLIILVPTVRDARRIAPFFCPRSVALMTGDEPAGRRFDAWSGFRRHATDTLIGTRLASLLLSEDADAILVLRSGDDSHKQEDKNPRYDARDNAWNHSERTGARLYFFDVLPRPDDLVRFQEPHMLFPPVFDAPPLVDMARERGASPHAMISFSASEAIERCLAENKRAICFYNRKGKARALRCDDCGYAFPCPRCGGALTVYETTVRCHHCQLVNPLPLSCPSCSGTHLIERGFGTRSVKSALSALFPTASVSIIEQGLVEDPNASILVATNHLTESVIDPFARRSDIGLILDLDADLPLHDSTFRSFENAMRQIQERRGLAQRWRAACLVQTRVFPLFAEAFEDPVRALRKELQLRRDYGYPPFARRMRLTCHGNDPRGGQIELEQARAKLETIKGLEARFSPILGTRPAMVLLTVQMSALPATLDVLRRLPDHVIIDTNAIS